MMQPHMAVAWKHRGEEQRRGEGRGVKKKNSLLPASGGLGSAETMATFHTDEGFFAAISAVNQAGQGEMPVTHAMPVLKGEFWKESRVTECSKKNKQS